MSMQLSSDLMDGLVLALLSKSLYLLTHKSKFRRVLRYLSQQCIPRRLKNVIG